MPKNEFDADALRGCAALSGISEALINIGRTGVSYRLAAAGTASTTRRCNYIGVSIRSVKCVYSFPHT
jgi:hypothetical protein